ncbi:MAG: hypothetical protein M1812_005086 [Candelaria pacifica]|nr:MAG: hypothetical protein M1812_005086 [Candelaria pacifica]
MAFLRSNALGRILFSVAVAAVLVFLLAFYSGSEYHPSPPWWNDPSKRPDAIGGKLQPLSIEDAEATIARLQGQLGESISQRKQDTINSHERINALQATIQNLSAEAALSGTPAFTSASNRSKSTGYRSADLQHLEGIEKVLLIMKTGATEALDKLTIHLMTTIPHVPNFLIFSDAEQRIGDYDIYDALEGYSEELMKERDDFKLYRYLQEYMPLGQDPKRLKLQGGWELDKWKFMHILSKTYKARPELDWYLFMEADSYVIWPNLLRWLKDFDHNQIFYLGSPSYLGNVLFAHGGTGYILSNAAMRASVGKDPDIGDKYNQDTGQTCCGDGVVAKALLDNGVTLTSSWPRLNGEPPYTIPFSEEQWCSPVVTFHHMLPIDVELMWEFERVNATAEYYILYADIFDHFIRPHIRAERSGWDNGSDDEKYEATAVEEQSKANQPDKPSSSKRSPASFEECRQACEAKDECLQFRVKAGECTFGHRVKFGQKVPFDNQQVNEYQSGWNFQRIEALRMKMNPCKQPSKESNDA